MRQIIIICIAFISISSVHKLHDSVSATFNIIEKGHVLMLEIDFDDKNFIKFGNSDTLKITKEGFRKYLTETTTWEIDGKKLIPQIVSLKSDREHTKVICFLSKAKKNIKTVKVRNEFLIDIKDHSNIIKLDLNNTFKDYRMHKKRSTLEVVY